MLRYVHWAPRIDFAWCTICPRYKALAEAAIGQVGEAELCAI